MSNGGSLCELSWNQVRLSAQVLLVSERGKEVCRVHREKAQRLLASKQAVVAPAHLRRKLITQLTIPHKEVGPVSGHGSNSLKATYLETLEGNETLRIETSADLPRYVTTVRCQVFKMKKIGRSLEPLYRAALNEAVVPFKAEYLKANPLPAKGM